MDINFISINPDTRNSSGHFLGYDLNLRKACNCFDIPFYSLCWKETPNDFLQQNHQFRPTFKDHSWIIGNQGIYGPQESVLKSFYKETESALQQILENISNATNVLYMYTGSLNHAEVLSQLALRYENVVLHVNLFWLPFKNINSPDFKKRWTTFLKFTYNSSKIHLTVPTEELQKDIKRMFDIKLGVAPHPSVLVSDQDFINLKIKQFNQLKLHNYSQGKTILFPGNLGGSKNKTSKGYFVSIEIIKILAEMYSEEENKYKIFMRRAFDNEDVDQELEKIKSVAYFFEDGLPSSDFFKILTLSDIVVLPYAKEAFSKRTSGLFIDSLYFGKPVVSSKNTWMGNRIEELDCGIVVAQNDDPNSFVEAIDQISKHYFYYQRNAIMAGIKWFQSNNWTSLLASYLHH